MELLYKQKVKAGDACVGALMDGHEIESKKHSLSTCAELKQKYCFCKLFYGK